MATLEILKMVDHDPSELEDVQDLLEVIRPLLRQANDVDGFLHIEIRRNVVDADA